MTLLVLFKLQQSGENEKKTSNVFLWSKYNIETWWGVYSQKGKKYRPIWIINPNFKILHWIVKNKTYQWTKIKIHHMTK